MAQAEFRGPIRLATIPSWRRLAETVAEIWREHLGVEVDLIDVSPASMLVGNDVDVQLTNWLPGYPDPEYYLRLLLHSESDTNFGHWSHPPFDELIERATAERDSSTRLELFHQADRLAVHEQCALIPVAYVGSFAYVKPWVHGWWEWGKSSASFADLVIDAASPRFAVASRDPTGA
jgi:oligopeptide transport system substrate-binding protein